VILDLRMPGMNGLELQRRMRAAGVRIPAIVVTAHSDEVSRARALAAGAAAFSGIHSSPTSSCRPSTRRCVSHGLRDWPRYDTTRSRHDVAARCDGNARDASKLPGRRPRLATRITGNAEDAEEAVQDALWSVIRKIGMFRGDAAFGSWLYRVVVNAAYQQLRKRRGRSADVSLDTVLPVFDEHGRQAEPVVDWSMRIDDPARQMELRRLLETAIEDLPADYRTVILLRDVEGLSYREIAEALDLGVVTIKARLHRARLFLRKRLDAHFSMAGVASLAGRATNRPLEASEGRDRARAQTTKTGPLALLMAAYWPVVARYCRDPCLEPAEHQRPKSPSERRRRTMKIVVIGGTGLIGSKSVAILRQGGHEVVPAAPNTGINTITGEGLKEAMAGTQVVIDLANSPSFEDRAVLEFFETSGRNLLAAEAAAGIVHHVALSIVGTDRTPENGYFRAKIAQEKLIEASRIPYTIIRSTQFMDFIGRIADSSADGNIVRLSPGLFQPIAADDVAAAVADVALAPPRNGIVEIAGPERAPFDEIVARYLKAVGDPRTVVRDPEARYWGGRVEERSLVPLGEARLGRIGLDEWLRRSQARA
jgi:RNA polymerase sigma factor (sigma-70 family)